MKTVVGILGTVHNDEMRERVGYPLELLRELILEFKPDVICGEVRPEDWARYQEDRSYSGYLGPSENRLCIIPLCEEQGIEFVPVDWFEDDLVQLDYERKLLEREKQVREAEIQALYEEIFRLAMLSPIPFNSPECDLAVKRKMEWLNRLNPEVHHVVTVARNQIMVERIRKAIETHQGKRILLTAGAEHNIFYAEALREDDRVTLVYPLR